MTPTAVQVVANQFNHRQAANVYIICYSSIILTESLHPVSRSSAFHNRSSVYYKNERHNPVIVSGRTRRGYHSNPARAALVLYM